jgi:serine/threonine protein kinase/Flp pilus assembly protein TadD
MSTSPSEPLTRAAAEALAAELAEELVRRWRQGERPVAEELLARHPALWQCPEAAADLIYEELSLRQEFGAEVPAEEVLRRFPAWRSQLEVLIDCQRLLAQRPAAPRFPEAGETLGDFLLLAELGRGAQGPVFLATQLSLGDRPVVLKLIPLDAHEHLSLARVQHTHIVPLYSVQDHAGRALRALCMPYFGGATLAQLLAALGPVPAARRSGKGLLEALRRVSSAQEAALCLPAGTPGPAASPAQHFLARATYAQAVCWLGACLADALHYAHERGLVHLDIKPSNVLLAADGQPMLLDFHLAREPLHPDGGKPHRLGGTAEYASPEQRSAMQAIQKGRKIPQRVDGRSDLYSLGIVLYEALAGDRPTMPVPPLHRRNPQVSVGLAEVVSKCLAAEAGQRYADMAAVAADLRRHLADLPLAGVPNSSVMERWQKWRRRRPHGTSLGAMALAVFLAVAAAALVAVGYYRDRVAQARAALDDGRARVAAAEWDGAIASLQRGRTLVHGLPFQRALAGELDCQLVKAVEGRAAAHTAAAIWELHRLADRVRFLDGAADGPVEQLRGLEACCDALWQKRCCVLHRVGAMNDPKLRQMVHEDLLDLALVWADLHVRLAPPGEADEARRQALVVLAEAEALCGPSAVLDEERQRHGGPPPPGGRVPGKDAATAWQRCALARALLRSGDVSRAAAEAEEAVRLEPQGLWPNFYRGLCAHRLGCPGEAVLAFSVCIGAAADAAPCFHNRALALEALGRRAEALADYDQALRLDPGLAAAALNRGLLHYRAQRPELALADLQRARALGAPPGLVDWNLFLIDVARGDQASALDNLRRAMRHQPRLLDARRIYVGRFATGS